MILLAGLACTIYGKYYVLRQSHLDGIFAATLQTSLTDLLFFGVVLLLVALGHACIPWKVSTRLALVAALVISCWSLANMAWLMATGVQIHQMVLTNLFRYPKEFGPIVTNRLANTPQLTYPLAVVALVALAFVIRRLVRPEPLRGWRKQYGYPSVLVMVAVGVLLGVGHMPGTFEPLPPRRAALSYSSHFLALSTTFGLNGHAAATHTNGSRRLPHAGGRKITPPPSFAPRPHVVMIIMESVAHWATSMGGRNGNTTPIMAELAGRGVTFGNARAVVPHTTESQFIMLTGATSSLEGDFVEAVIADSPYESLATILGAAGYRSRFSQMVRATFECNPGLFANLGFQEFWAREDNGDSRDHLGYFAGDDFKMIDPAFAWFDRQDAPCFLAFMTSVAHDPYEVPGWYASPVNGPKDAYLQAVAFTDAFVGRIITELRARGVLDNTLLCVIADHGEGFGEHDIRQHGQNPYEESLRIPWIISWPKKIPPGKVVTAPTSVLDVTPTVLNLLGYDTSPADFDGMDALSDVPPNRKLFFATWNVYDPAGYVLGNTKTMYWPRLDAAYRFDLEKDPRENNPIPMNEEETERLRQEIIAWREHNRITFDAKRYREKFLFGHWQTSGFGNTAWCYYIPSTSEKHP